MKYLLVFFLLPLQLSAQDITGVWTGTLYNDTTGQYLKYELAISEYEGKLSGYSHTIFVIDSVENIGVKSVMITKSGDDYLIQDNKLIYNNYTSPPAKGVRTFSDLRLFETDSTWELKGSWKTNRTRVYKSVTGNILLHRKKKIEETLIMPKLEKLGLARSLSFMSGTYRANDVAVSSVITPPAPVSVNKYGTGAGIVMLEAPDADFPGSDPLQPKPQQAGMDENAPLPKDSVDRTVAGPSPVLNKKNATPPNKGNMPATAPNREVPLPVITQNKKKDTTSERNETVLAAAGNNKLKAGKESSRETGEIGHSAPENMPVTRKDAPLVKGAGAGATPIENTGQTAGKEDTLAAGKMQEKIPATAEVQKPESNSKVQEETSITSTSVPPGIVAKKETGIIADGPRLNNDGNRVLPDNARPALTAAAQIASRKIETIKSVTIKSDSLVLTLYDNGEVDGDTVSVLLNGQVIMPMEGLSTNAINKTVYLTPEMGDSIKLIMYAENLGSIPPNTGLLVVHDGDDVYYIRFSGDLQKNSAIILRRQKGNLKQH